ncbi:hypothetical protein C8R46DRAFT_1038731 [Mycena filopes]|nr:hypothetical protein C8R46DRAFT_1038731 [Mycena filopes]
MAIHRSSWRQIDGSAVLPSSGYPPAVPPFPSADAQPLVEALTDILCRVHFPDVACNEKYRALGDRLCELAFTLIAIEEFLSSCPAALNECMNPDLYARFGPFYRLDHHLRTLRPLGNYSFIVSARESGHAFCAVVGAVYTILGRPPGPPLASRALLPGWEKLIVWLPGLGQFRVRASVEGMHQARVKQQTEGHAADIKTHPTSRSHPDPGASKTFPDAKHGRPCYSTNGM